MRRLAIAGAIFCGFLLVTGIALGVVAIWTVGPDAARWGGTSAVLTIVGLFGGMLCGLAAVES